MHLRNYLRQNAKVRFQLLEEEIVLKSDWGKRIKPKINDLGSAFLKDAKGTNDRFRHSFALASNLKVLQRSLRLCAPQPLKEI